MRIVSKPTNPAGSAPCVLHRKAFRFVINHPLWELFPNEFRKSWVYRYPLLILSIRRGDQLTMTVSTDLHSSVKTKVEELINFCENLKRKSAELNGQLKSLETENDRLLQENQNLQQQLGQYQKQNMELNHRVEILKNAETLNRSDEKSKEVKTRINELMREIDNCITLLSK
jgi:septal ring factor EnvC (AmiA/AmiB activator)